MRTNRKWMAVGLLTAIQLFGTCKKNTLEIAQIYGATAYLKGVRMLRNFFLYQISILACVMLLVLGIVLMEVAVIFYLPLSVPTRAILAFVLGAMDVLAGGLSLVYFASSERWLDQASKYNAQIKALISQTKCKGS